MCIGYKKYLFIFDNEPHATKTDGSVIIIDNTY